VRRFAYSRDGYLGPAAIVAEVDPSNGAPDGMTIDVDGCIWVALWGGQAVHRYTPDGELDTIIDVPVTNVTSCCFGGTDMATLFITTAGDFNDPVSSHSGKLFACQPGVSGWPENLFGI
jgi:sugar lactone lactonase YvrE